MTNDDGTGPHRDPTPDGEPGPPSARVRAGAGGQPLVRLGSPGELAAAVPYLLGFRPEESLVVVGFTEGSNRVGLSVRCDLADIAEPEFAEALAAVLARNSIRAAVLAVFTETTPVDGGPATPGSTRPAPDLPPALPYAGPVRAVTDTLDEHGIERKDALLVAGGRWWSYACQDLRCCPAEGTLLPEATTRLLREAAAWAGYGDVAPDRAHLSRALDRDETAADSIRRQLDGAGPLPLHEAMRAVDDAVARYGDGRSVLDDVEVARLLRALQDVQVRDAAVRRTGGDEPSAVWRDVLTRAPAGWAAAPATLVGIDAYRRGDGATARLALDRALAEDPDYRLALLMLSALDAGLSPLVVSSAIESAAQDAQDVEPAPSFTTGSTSTTRVSSPDGSRWADGDGVAS